MSKELHCTLSCAVDRNHPCLCVCLFVGPPYYSQRAMFVSPLSAFSLKLLLEHHREKEFSKLYALLVVCCVASTISMLVWVKGKVCRTPHLPS